MLLVKGWGGIVESEQRQEVEKKNDICQERNEAQLRKLPWAPTHWLKQLFLHKSVILLEEGSDTY